MVTVMMVLRNMMERLMAVCVMSTTMMWSCLMEMLMVRRSFGHRIQEWRRDSDAIDVEEYMKWCWHRMMHEEWLMNNISIKGGYCRWLLKYIYHAYMCTWPYSWWWRWIKMAIKIDGVVLTKHSKSYKGTDKWWWWHWNSFILWNDCK